MARIPLVEPKCGMCRHFHLDPREAIDGECRRHAPQVRAGSGILSGVWPIVLASDLCGDYGVDHARALALVRKPDAVDERLHTPPNEWRA